MNIVRVSPPCGGAPWICNRRVNSYFHSNAALSVADYYRVRFGAAPGRLRERLDFRVRLFSEIATRPAAQVANFYKLMSDLEPCHPLAVKLLDWLREHPPEDKVFLRQLLWQSIADAHPLASLCAPWLEDTPESAVVYVTGELLALPKTLLGEIGAADKVSCVLDTTGGDSRAAFQLHDALKAKDSTGVVTNMACSAGAIILQGCRRRLVCQSATVMVHDARIAVYGTACEVQLMVDGLKEADEKAWHVFDRCPVSLVKEWRESGTDHYFTATQAVAAGLADLVVPDFELASGSTPPSTSTPGATPDAEAEALLTDLLARSKPLFKDEREFERVLQAFFHHS